MTTIGRIFFAPTAQAESIVQLIVACAGRRPLLADRPAIDFVLVAGIQPRKPIDELVDEPFGYKPSSALTNSAQPDASEPLTCPPEDGGAMGRRLK